MRRTALLCAVALLALLGRADTSEAGRGSTATVVVRNSQQLDTLIENQSQAYLNDMGNVYLPGEPCADLYSYKVSPSGLTPVVNPLCAQGYLWDVDDHVRYSGSGDLAAGASIVIEQPIVIDGVSPHLILATYSTRNTTLTVTIDALGFSATVPQSGTGCWLTPWLDPATLPEIAGSNGGHGMVTTVRWTLTADKRVRNAYLDARVLNTVAGNIALCPQAIPYIGS